MVSPSSPAPPPPASVVPALRPDRDPVPGTVAVIGLGLIGGSLARDLVARGVRVLGHDRDAATAREACAAGVLCGGIEVAGDAPDGLQAAEVVIVATPVDEAPAVLASLGRARAQGRLGARLVTDVGSTKRSTVDAAVAHGLGDLFVGSHPLAGDHRWGWGASRRELFAGARVYLCPAADASADSRELARQLWSGLGAIPEWCDAAAHDEMLAWSSHLPQVAATALALVLHRSGVERARLGPGGRDTTRLAGSSPDLWTAIARDNATSLTAAVELLERQLGELRSALLAGDGSGLRERFADAREWFVTDDEGAGVGGVGGAGGAGGVSPHPS